MSTLCLKSAICANMICEKQILELRREGKLESTKLKVKAEENIDQTKVKIEKTLRDVSVSQSTSLTMMENDNYLRGYSDQDAIKNIKKLTLAGTKGAVASLQGRCCFLNVVRYYWKQVLFRQLIVRVCEY